MSFEEENAPIISEELLEFLKKSSEESVHVEERNPSNLKTNTIIDDKDGNGFKSDKYSGFNLFKFEFDEIPKILDPIFPEVGIVSLVGSSDTGKSTFLRQLGLSIAIGLDSFLGYKISTKANRVIYVSTEDDPTSTSIVIKRQIKGISKHIEIDESRLNNIKFIFDCDLAANSKRNLFDLLDYDLSTIGADLIIVDAFTDLFNGDLNSSPRVREFLNIFSKIAKTYNCLILFLHHTGKRTDRFTASKDNVLGSQAFEAKMRVLLELKQYPNDDSKRTITITKGNYISSDVKKYSKILKFDEEDLLFYEIGQILSSSISTLSKTKYDKKEIFETIKTLSDKKLSIRKIETELKQKGYNLGKSTISNYLNEIKNSQHNE